MNVEIGNEAAQISFLGIHKFDLVSVIFVFPKLKFIFLSKEVYRSYLLIYKSRKEDAVQIWIHINDH
jgi:hypothetical protein